MPSGNTAQYYMHLSTNAPLPLTKDLFMFKFEDEKIISQICQVL